MVWFYYRADTFYLKNYNLSTDTSMTNKILCISNLFIILYRSVNFHMPLFLHRFDPGNPGVQCQYSSDGWHPVWESRKRQLGRGLQGSGLYSPSDGPWQWGEVQFPFASEKQVVYLHDTFKLKNYTLLHFSVSLYTLILWDVFLWI